MDAWVWILIAVDALLIVVGAAFLIDRRRRRYRVQWGELQGRFVDRPVVAVADADELIAQVMRERGYPVDDFESQSELISVVHAAVVQNYRQAHAIYAGTVDG